MILRKALKMGSLPQNNVVYENVSVPQPETQRLSRIQRLLQYGKYQGTLDVDDVDLSIKDSFSSKRTTLDDGHGSNDTSTIDDDMNAAKEFFRDHFFAIFVCMLSGLYTLMFIPSISILLFYTRKSDNPIKAFTRYLDTLNHTIQWYSSPFDRTKSLKTVRKLHAIAARQTLGRIREEKCLVTENRAVPMSQYDLVLTQWAFIGAILTQPDRIGIPDVSKVQLKSIANQMYKVGRDLGISNDFNLCSGPIEDTIQYAKDIEKYVITPALELDKDFESMSVHLMNGVNILNPFIDPLAFSTWTHKLYSAKKSYQRRFEMLLSYKSWCFYYLQLFLFEYVLCNNLLKWTVTMSLNTMMDMNVHMANLHRQRITKKYYPDKLPLPLYLWIYGILSYIKMRFLKLLKCQNIV